MTLTSDQIGDIEFALRSRDWRTELSRCDRDALLALVSAARANAKLVEALKNARPYLVSACHFQEDARATDIIFEIDAAFKAAGVKP